MSNPNDCGPAFPTNNGMFVGEGMSLRDYFAAKVNIPEDMGWAAAALMGEMPPKWSAEGDFEQSMKCVEWWATAEAKYRYIRADAMLTAREVKQ